MTQLTPATRSDSSERKVSKLGVAGAKHAQTSTEALEGSAEDRVVEAVTRDRAIKATSSNSKALEITKIIDDVEEHVHQVQRDLNFCLDEHDGKLRVLVIDSQTQELVRDIPEEELERMQHDIDHVKGLIIETRA